MTAQPSASLSKHIAAVETASAIFGGGKKMPTPSVKAELRQWLDAAAETLRKLQSEMRP